MTDDVLAGRDRVVNLLNDLVEELESGADWENNSLVRYLEAFGALLGSIENAYANQGRTIPTSPWTVIADALRGARHYE